MRVRRMENTPGTMTSVPTSAIPRTLSRRTALRMTGGIVLAAVGSTSVAGCSSGDDAEAGAVVDTLTSHLDLARRDAAAATSLTAMAPEIGGALAVVRSEREQHAASLAAEIDRVAGVSPDETTTAAAPSTSGAAVPPPTVEELRSYLSESQRAAADSAREESGYRAGLLGSISAACAVHLAVVAA